MAFAHERCSGVPVVHGVVHGVVRTLYGNEQHVVVQWRMRRRCSKGGEDASAARWEPVGSRVRTMFVCPIRRGDRVVGVIAHRIGSIVRADRSPGSGRRAKIDSADRFQGGVA